MAPSQSLKSSRRGKSKATPPLPSKGVQNRNQSRRQRPTGCSPAGHNAPTAPSKAIDTARSSRAPVTPSSSAPNPSDPAPATTSSQQPVSLLTKEDYEAVIALPYAKQGAAMRDLGIELVGKSKKKRATILEHWLRTPRPDERDRTPDVLAPKASSGVNQNVADKHFGPKKAESKAKRLLEKSVWDTEEDLAEQLGTPGSIESCASSKPPSPDPRLDRSTTTKKPRPSRIRGRLCVNPGEQLDRAIEESLAEQESADPTTAKHEDRSPSDSLKDYEYYEALEREAEELEALKREAAQGASLQGPNARSPGKQLASADDTLFGDLGRGRGYDPSIEDFRNLSQFDLSCEGAVSGRVNSRFYTPGRGNVPALVAGSSRLVATNGPQSA